MGKRPLAALVAVGGLWAAMALVGGDELPERAAERLPAPVTDAHELMEIFHERLYERLHEDLKSKPTDRGGWNRLKDYGIEAAELANMTAIRQVEPARRQEWIRLSREAQQAGLDLAHAAAAQDWEKTQGVYRALVANCNGCHQSFAPDKAPQLEP